MKLQVTQVNLAKALNTVGRVASTRGTLPILANVLLKTEGNRLSVSATNLDIAITHFIGAKMDAKGSITVPARLMQDLISNLPDSTINLELEGNKLQITTDKHKSTINGVGAEDFPVTPAISAEASWSVPAVDFKKVLSQVVFAAGSDDARPVLTGVYFHTKQNEVLVAATDSYRLAQASLGKTKVDQTFLLPSSAANDLLRIITETDKEVLVNHDDQQAMFRVGDVTLVARLIEGNYPDYQKLIPAKFTTVAKLLRTDFASIAKVSSLFARESAGSITIKVDQPTNQVSINAVASQIGENTATADALVKGGGEVTLNSRYLVDALSVFSGKEIEFCFNGKLEPCILRSPGEPDLVHLIMPLRS